MATPRGIKRYTAGRTSGCASGSFQRNAQELRGGRGAQAARKKLELAARQGAGRQVGRQEGIRGTHWVKVKNHRIAATQKKLQVACVARKSIRTIQVSGVGVVKIDNNGRAQHQRDEGGRNSMHDMSVE